jgi:ankyrin repeat protein
MKKSALCLSFSFVLMVFLHTAITVAQQSQEQDNTRVPGKLPLHDACDEDGSLEQLVATIKALSEKQLLGVAINQQDAEGNTALHLAAERNNQGMVQALLSAGASNKILNYSDALPCDFVIDEQSPLQALLWVTDQERQDLVMQARAKEIEIAKEIDERVVKAPQIAVVDVSLLEQS